METEARLEMAVKLRDLALRIETGNIENVILTETIIIIPGHDEDTGITISQDTGQRVWVLQFKLN